MREILVFIILFFALSSFATAQSSPLVPDKVKQIKLLESTRDDVQKILVGYKTYNSIDFDAHNTYDPGFYQEFFAENETIKVLYSHDGCSNNWSNWDVPDWKVIQISISPDKAITLKDINFNYSGFIKERAYINEPNYYIYHNKNIGMAYMIDENEIRKLILSPGRTQYSLLCNDRDLRKFYAGKKWFNDGLTWKKRIHEGPNYYADVTDLVLSASEVIVQCPALSPSEISKVNESPSETLSKINVSITAEDRENDVLTYDYYVTGGKIIGKGSKVVWDLSGEKPGTYSITAGADDGCGVCGRTKTKTVTVKESPDCTVK